MEMVNIIEGRTFSIIKNYIKSSPCIMYVQYIGECSVHRGDIKSTSGGCSVHRGDILSTSGDVSTLGIP